MAPSRLTEKQAIEILQRELEGKGPSARAKGSGSPHLGIGDDAAIVRLSGQRARSSGQRLVWSIDTSAEGTHFDRRWLDLEQAAARAMVAALSDLAAMGAKPVAALCALSVPATTTAEELRAIGRGQRRVAERHSCPMLGGNLCRAERIEFTTSVLGKSARPLLRSGAQPGDEVWLIGELGLAAAGLRLLQATSGRRMQRLDRAAADCVRAWTTPEALIVRGTQLVSRASSGIDVSDGLANEAWHLARASGVKLVLSERQLLAHAHPSLGGACKRLGVPPLELMLYGGEDYALLATGHPGLRPRWARVIGKVYQGRGAWLAAGNGGRNVLLGAGFDHLAPPSRARRGGSRK